MSYYEMSPLTTVLMSCDVEGKSVTSIFSSFIFVIVSSTFSCLNRTGCWTHTSIGSSLSEKWHSRLDWIFDKGVVGVFFLKNWLTLPTSFLRPLLRADLPLTITAGVSGDMGGDSKWVWHSCCLERWRYKNSLKDINYLACRDGSWWSVENRLCWFRCFLDESTSKSKQPIKKSILKIKLFLSTLVARV